MKMEFSGNMTAKHLAAVILVLSASAVMADDEYIVYQNECIGCHVGSTSNGDVTGPLLGGLADKYILRQLKAFKHGWRGAGHPAARTMSDAIASYSDEELKDISHWASNIKSDKHFDYSLGKGRDGYQLYSDKCKGCHDSVIGRYMTESPKISYLDTDYIIRQLHFFDEGFRNFDQPTKHQLKMQTVVKSLTDDEFEALTRFIANASLDRDEDLDD
jgi:cytochrome c553